MNRKNLSFTIAGEPQAKARPRFSKYKGRVSVYNPHKDLSDTRRWQVKAKVKGHEIIDAPIEADITFHMPIPKSITKKRREDILNGSIKHTLKIDIDNLLKEILDNMNGIVYKDDKLIYKISSSKVYSKNPRTEISISWLED